MLPARLQVLPWLEGRPHKASRLIRLPRIVRQLLRSQVRPERRTSDCRQNLSRTAYVLSYLRDATVCTIVSVRADRSRRKVLQPAAKQRSARLKAMPDTKSCLHHGLPPNLD